MPVPHGLWAQHTARDVGYMFNNYCHCIHQLLCAYVLTSQGLEMNHVFLPLLSKGQSLGQNVGENYRVQKCCPGFHLRHGLLLWILFGEMFQGTCMSHGHTWPAAEIQGHTKEERTRHLLTTKIFTITPLECQFNLEFPGTQASENVVGSRVLFLFCF